MGWNNGEQGNAKQGINLSSKILLAIIACIILIIVLIVMLLMNMKENTTTSVSIYVDGALSATSQDVLLTTIDNKIYVNIEEFAKLVGYEYHIGEYKAFSIDEDKCYVQGTEETASFYLNDNTIYKLPVNKIEEEYQKYTVENKVEKVEGKMYASVEAINKAFNVVINQTTNSFEIYTLNHLVTVYDTSVIEWGYTSIAGQNFENKKSILYGYLIVNKENGLYKIIDLQNTKEIVSDKYKTIQFSENAQEFVVTNSLGKVGIVDFNGKTKLDLIYESVEILDKESNLYLVKQSAKYGVVKSGDIIIVYPEYDSIGIKNSNITNTMDNKYLIFDTLIPVCKSQKWGAYNKEGKIILSVEYDGLGYELNNVDVNGVKKVVEPILTIERCNGIVVKKSEKYGLIDLNGNVLVPIAVDAIYGIANVENENSKYFMLYDGKELNVIERLTAAGLIEKTTDENEKTENTENTSNNTNQNIANGTVAENDITNNKADTTANDTNNLNNQVQ